MALMFPYKELEDALKLDLRSAGFDDGVYCSWLDPKHAAMAALLHSFYKKLAPDGVSDEAAAAALKKFRAINDAISPDRHWVVEDRDQGSVFWGLFRDHIGRALNPAHAELDLEWFRENAAIGPGASLGCDNESFYTKLFASRLSATHPYLLAYYRAAIVDHPTWSEAERLRFDRFGDSIVSGNRLFFVEKTTEIARTCCTEPLGNMLHQQAIGMFIGECLRKSFGINLSTQPDHNRELARIGSIDGSFGTIDLQSASDSISWRLLQQILPNPVRGGIAISRSPVTILPDGSEIAMNMVSTMGNGFTFPLQTIIFACVVRSVYNMHGFRCADPKTEFGVFGDDIVVRRETYDDVCYYLTQLGFKVNDDKSFNDGPFRESCGYDWHNGQFIRGVYIRRLKTLSDLYSAVNRLNAWTARTGVPLTRTVGALLGEIDKKTRVGKTPKRFLVPFSAPVDAGLRVPFDMTVPRVDNNYWFVYRQLSKRAKRRAVPDDLAGSRALGYVSYNENGFAISRLGGYAGNSEVPLIDQRSLTRGPNWQQPVAYFTLRDAGSGLQSKVVRRTIPFWDWFGRDESQPGLYGVDHHIDSNLRLMSFGSWKAAVAVNVKI
jgi:hypothetical protein